MTPALELQQPDRGQFVGDQDVEEPAAQRAGNSRRLVDAASDSDDLRDVPKVGKLYPDPPVVDGELDDVSIGIKELPENVADDFPLAQGPRWTGSELGKSGGRYWD